MREIFIRSGRFIVAIIFCTIVSTLIWQVCVAGTVYHCTDPLFLDFLTPGSWGHAPLHGDTILAGWNMTGLWCLWYSFLIASVIVSLACAAISPADFLQRLHHKFRLTNNS